MGVHDNWIRQNTKKKFDDWESMIVETRDNKFSVKKA